MNTPLIPLGLALIMITVGLSVQLKDFRALGQQLRAVGAGLLAQIIFLPLIALSVALITKLDPVYAVGLVVLAAAPGGITSNLLTVLARGKTALSISLTILTNMMAFVTVPTILTLAVWAFSETLTPAATEQNLFALPFGKMVIGVLVISALPLALGMAISHRLPLLAMRIEGKAKFIASAIFAAIVVTSFVSEWNAISNHWTDIGPAVILLNSLAIASALLTSRLFRLSARQILTVAIECGLQNVALALVIGQILLQDGRLMVPASMYALIMNVSVLVLIAIGRRIVRSEEEDQKSAQSSQS